MQEPLYHKVKFRFCVVTQEDNMNVSDSMSINEFAKIFVFRDEYSLKPFCYLNNISVSYATNFRSDGIHIVPFFSQAINDVLMQVFVGNNHASKTTS